MMDHPLDLGIVLGSTNDDIWTAEMGRHDGLIAYRRLMEHYVESASDPGMTPRRLLQKAFAQAPDIETAKARLLEIAESLAMLAKAPVAEIDAAHDRITGADKPRPSHSLLDLLTGDGLRILRL